MNELLQNLTLKDIGESHRLSDIVRVMEACGSVFAPHEKGGYQGNCVLCDDTESSLRVNWSAQVFACKACDAMGDAHKFVRQYHRFDFARTVEWLVHFAGEQLQYEKGDENGTLQLRLQNS